METTIFFGFYRIFSAMYGFYSGFRSQLPIKVKFRQWNILL